MPRTGDLIVAKSYSSLHIGNRESASGRKRIYPLRNCRRPRVAPAAIACRAKHGSGAEAGF